MLDPQPTWQDPLHQGALLALVRAGGAPHLFSPHESHWIIDASRSAVLLALPEGVRPDVLETQLRKLLSRFPQGGVEVVIVGGGVGLRDAIVNAMPRYSRSSIGAIHVSDEGDVWVRKANSVVANAMRAMFANGIPSPVPLAEVTDELAAAAAAARTRIEALQSFSRTLSTGTPWATYVLSAVLVAIFGLEWHFGHANTLTLLRMGACMADRVKHGEVWRLLSSALLHASLVHLGFNTVSLLSLGAFYERLIGAGRMLVLFVLAAIGGSLAVVFFSRVGVVVGASGGIFGMLGAAAALALRPGTLLPPDYVPAFRRNMMMNLMLQAGFAAVPNVSIAAHVGGGLVGFALMISGLLVPRVDDQGRRRSSWMVPAVIAGALLVGSFAAAMVHNTPWRLSTHWSRQTLTGTGLSAELPGPFRAVPRQDGVHEFESGSAEDDGFVASVVISTLDLPDTPEARTQAVEAIRTHGVYHPPNTQPAGDPQVLSVAGFPVAAQDARDENGVQFRNWMQFRHATVVSVQMWSRPDAPAAIQDVPRRILASIRGDQ